MYSDCQKFIKLERDLGQCFRKANLFSSKVPQRSPVCGGMVRVLLSNVRDGNIPMVILEQRGVGQVRQ